MSRVAITTDLDAVVEFDSVTMRIPVSYTHLTLPTTPYV